MDLVEYLADCVVDSLESNATDALVSQTNFHSLAEMMKLVCLLLADALPVSKRIV